MQQLAYAVLAALFVYCAIIIIISFGHMIGHIVHDVILSIRQSKSSK